MPNGNKKGSSFERKICKQLSTWWSGGTRDDIFWRSSQSGGRATQRAKSGKRTFGSYGDIAAVDPIGQPLLKLFTIELKRGRSHGHPEDLVDREHGPCQRPFESCLMQAITAHKEAQSFSWLLICKRDCKQVMAYIPFEVFTLIGLLAFGDTPHAKYQLLVHSGVKKGAAQRLRLRFVGMALHDFLNLLSPRDVISAIKSQKS